MPNNIGQIIAALILCLLIALAAIIIFNWKSPVLMRSYRLVYTLELRSSDSKRINLNWTAPSNMTNFQSVTLLNYSLSPSWTITDENNNTIAHFSIDLQSGQNLNISMTALITVNATQYRTADNPLQYDVTSTVFERYTRAEKYIESDNPLIIELGRNITKSFSDPADASCAICEWVCSNINYSEPSPTPYGALWALKNRTGDCSEHTFLFVALCRAANIPARFINGIYTRNINATSWGNQNWTDIGHDWAEVYLPAQGWVWVDPTSGCYGCSDGEHIALQVGQYCASLNGHYRYSYVGNANITEHFEIYPEG